MAWTITAIDHGIAPLKYGVYIGDYSNKPTCMHVYLKKIVRIVR